MHSMFQPGKSATGVGRSLTWLRYRQYISSRRQPSVREGSSNCRADAPVPSIRRWRGVWLMLSRSSAVIISLTSLSAGIVLGILLGRGGPVVSAQVAGAGRDGLAASRRLARQRQPCLAKSSPTTRFTTSWPNSTNNFSRSTGRSSWWPRRSRRPWCTSWRRRRRGPRKAGSPARSRRPARASSSEATASPAFSS